MQLIRNGWHIQTISNKQTCALSQFYDWLISRNVRVMLVEGVRRDGQDQYCAVFVTSYQPFRDTVSFRFPPLQHSPVSWTIKQHARVRVRARRAGDGALERPLIIVCNSTGQQLMNLH